MSKKILINASHQEENRVAIVEDGLLTELDIEIEGREQTRGNIYKATVVRVESGLQAAFVDYGADRMGFLQIGEIHPDLYPKDAQEGNNRPRINDILKRGQDLLVQIIREERGSKGAALTTNLSLAGRYMVLMPGSSTKGISRKIENEAQRKELKTAMASIDIPENAGYIVRTAGIGQSIDELHRDFKYLFGIYTKIIDLAESSKAPKLIYQESNLVIRSIRDYFSPEMDEVLIDDPVMFREAQDFFRSVMPEYLNLLKRHQEHRPIFSRYQIEEQIETISQNKVPLPSGGSIVIDLTEALVAVDVNSGKMAGEKGIEATAFKTNVEAAAEVGRQLRLRDLGGLIVIDFIDMRDRKNNRDVEKALKNSLKHDKARVSVGRISQFGLLEMSRQRIRAALAEGAFLPCPHCDGSGRVKGTEAQAVAFLRRVHTTCAKGAIERVEAKVPTKVADYLLNAKREELVELEKSLKLTIEIKGQDDYISGQSDLEIHKRVKQVREVKSFDPITATDERPELTEEDKIPKEPPVEKPKRKRRRKTAAEKKAEMEAAAAAADGQVSDTQDEQPQVTAEAEPAISVDTADASDVPVTTDGEPVPSEEKPKRRRRRRKTAAEKKAEMEAAAAALETDDQAATAADEQHSATPEKNTSEGTAVTPVTDAATTSPEEKPKQPRRRRKTAEEEKAEVEAAIATALEGKNKTEDSPTELLPVVQQERPLMVLTETDNSESASSTPEDKPKRRRRRKTVAEKRAELDAAASTKTNDQLPVVPTEQTPVATEEKTVVSTELPLQETGATIAPEEQPKRRRRRKTVAEKRAELDAAAKIKAEEQPVPVEVSPEATVPTALAETVAPTAELSTATGSSVEEKPKRPRRKPAAIKSDVSPDESPQQEANQLPDSSEPE